MKHALGRLDFAFAGSLLQQLSPKSERINKFLKSIKIKKEEKNLFLDQNIPSSNQNVMIS